MCVCSKRERERNFVCCWKAEIGKKEDSEESLSIIHKFFYLQISTLVIRPLREKKIYKAEICFKASYQSLNSRNSRQSQSHLPRVTGWLHRENR